MRVTGVRRRRSGLPAAALVVAGIAAGLLAATPVGAVDRAAKACASARSHVTQQQKQIDDLERRIERERQSRFACGSKKACRRYDQRVESLTKRRDEQKLRLERLEAVAAKDCAPPAR